MADGTQTHAARLLCVGCGRFLSWIPFVARDIILSAAEAAPGTIIAYPKFDKTLDGSCISNHAKPCSCARLAVVFKRRGVDIGNGADSCAGAKLGGLQVVAWEVVVYSGHQKVLSAIAVVVRISGSSADG
jgi:hypothetical protein